MTWNASRVVSGHTRTVPIWRTCSGKGCAMAYGQRGKQGSDETFFTRDDVPGPAVHVGPQWVLVDPTSSLAQNLDVLRPGRGPQPVLRAGTPREVLVQIWDELVGFKAVQAMSR